MIALFEFQRAETIFNVLRALRRFERYVSETQTVEIYVYAIQLHLVEVNGLEPMTSCLQSRRSPN